LIQINTDIGALVGNTSTLREPRTRGPRFSFRAKRLDMHWVISGVVRAD
jgi:hypothetical protein